MDDNPNHRVPFDASKGNEDDRKRTLTAYAESTTTDPATALNAALSLAAQTPAHNVLMSRADDMTVNQVLDAVVSAGINFTLNLWNTYLVNSAVGTIPDEHILELGDLMPASLAKLVTELAPTNRARLAKHIQRVHAEDAEAANGR